MKALHFKGMPAMPPALWRHTQGVAATAQLFAKAFGVDPHKAWFAGLLHDWAKALPEKSARSMSKRAGLDREEIKLPALWHGALSACLAKERLGVHDRQILDAIRWHSTGRANMGALEKVIFLADMIEPGRKYPGVDDLRAQAIEDAEQAFRNAARHKLLFLIQKGQRIHSRGIALYHSTMEP
jgi:predicted HD superfamily hydrolase involved in NAD metabolism